MTYEEEKAIRDATPIQTTYGLINDLYHALRNAQDSIQVFYPGADWNQRKGMQALMCEMNEVEERCLELLRPILNPNEPDTSEE